MVTSFALATFMLKTGLMGVCVWSCVCLGAGNGLAKLRKRETQRVWENSPYLQRTDKN